MSSNSVEKIAWEKWIDLKSEFGGLTDTTARQLLFQKYCQWLLAARASNTLNDEFVATAISHGMFLPGLDDDPLSEEITMYAGEAEHTSGARARLLWSRIEQLSQELGRGSTAPS